MAKKQINEAKTIEGKILSSLLEGSKTNTQLLEELEYDTKKHGNISKPLKNLERKLLIKYKHVKSEKIDDFCKQWSIIPNYKNFKKMFDEHSYLFSKLHINDMVLDSILEASQCSETVFDPVQGINIKYTFRIPEEIKQDSKEKMRLSPEFFRRCFSSANIPQENAREIVELIEKLESKSTNAESGCLDNSSKAQNDIMTLFKVCVFYDVINEQSSEEAKEYLIKEQGKVMVINSMQIISRTTQLK